MSTTYISSGETVSNLTIAAGTTVVVEAGGAIVDTTGHGTEIDGTLIVDSGGNFTGGSYVANYGTVITDGPLGGGQFEVDQNNSEIIDSEAAANQGNLNLDPAGFSYFNHTFSIDLTNYSIAGASVAVVNKNIIVTLANGNTVDIPTTGTNSPTNGGAIHITNDGHGGILIGNASNVAGTATSAGTNWIVTNAGGVNYWHLAGETVSQVGPPTSVAAPDTITIMNGATATGFTDLGPAIYVSSGGTLLNEQVSSGTVFVSSGGYATSDTLISATETISAGGVISAGVISGMPTGSRGDVIVSSGGIANGVTIDGGTLLLAASATVQNGITFGPNPAGLLSIQGVPSSGGTFLSGQIITGFASAGDHIYVPGLSLSSGATMSEGPGGVAVLTNGVGGATYTFDIAGVPVGDTFLFDNSVSAVYIDGFACFLPGTRILTPSGDAVVEGLREGDLVMTAAGAVKPIRWIGYRQVVTADLVDPHLHAPVCIGRNAIAPGKPERDLWVTPDHGILVQGRLIPAKLLVNGASIRSVPRERYSYYHVELDQHDLLLAEGLEAESFLDVMGARQRYDNHAVTNLHHGVTLTQMTEQAYAERGCLPLCLAADDVQPVWQALADRAVAFGGGRQLWSSDPDLGLMVGGVLLSPDSINGDVYEFSLPPGADQVVISSRAASPWQRRPWIDDRRMLGVAISDITCVRWRKAAVPATAAVPAHREPVIAEQALPLDGDRIGGGWHALEPMRDGTSWFRWTNGAAALSLPRGTFKLMLKVSAIVDYPLADQHDQARGADHKVA